MSLSTQGICRRLAAFAIAGAALIGAANGARAEQSAEKAAAGTAEDKHKKSDEAASKEEKTDKPKLAVTHHTLSLDGDTIEVTATAGKLPLKGDDGKTKANVFYVAYTKDGAEPGERPITFCFNGGPGSSSVWLHIGMLGPKRVQINSDATPQRPPAKLIDNEYSLLDVTDLVFIDPVSTGFSRPAEGEDKKQFHGYREDLQSVGQFIHDYTSRNNRWGSPRFLLGESYGGLRAAGLAGHLQDRYRMDLNGVVLVSAVVDFSTISFSWTHDLAYELFLPSYAATAWYHGRLAPKWQDRPVEEVVEAARRFVHGPYRKALFAGAGCPPKQFDRVAAKMAELTGLSEQYVRRANLRVAMWQFGKELLRDSGQVVGRFDSRYTGVDRSQIGEATENDPSGPPVFAFFTSAINQYLREDLQVTDEGVYEILTGKVHPWNYEQFVNDFANSETPLQSAMTTNRFLKVFAACGYYDLATPFFAMEYSRDHIELPPDLQANFTVGYYQAGHMMYNHEPSLAKLREDLVEFYRDALGEKAESEPAAAQDDRPAA